MAVDQTNFPVDGRRQLGDAHAQGKQAVFHHDSVVLQLALVLAVADVARVLFVGGLQFRHQELLFKRQGEDVFQQRPQRVHVFAGRFRLGLLLHGFHLLRQLLHLLCRVFLGIRRLLLFAFVELFGAFVHFLLDGLLFAGTVHHGVRVLELLVVFLELFQVFLDLIERRVEAVLFGLELLRIFQPKLGFLRQLLLFLGQPLEVVDGLVHFGLPLQLAELFKGPVELLFHGVVVELHLIQLLLQLFRVHLLHELLHLLKQLAHFFAHQVVHQLLELLLLVQHALLLLGKFVGAFVFLGVVALHLLQLFLKRLLLFQQVLHGLTVLPGHLALLAKPFLHGLHGLPQLCGLLGGVLQVFFDGFCGVDALFPQVSRGGRFQPRGGGPHLLGPMHSVVVPNLKPSLQHIAFSPIQVTQIPHVVERPASALRNLKLDPPIG